MSYYMILTAAGQAKLALAIANATPLPLAAMALGDGNGAPMTPTEGMEALIHEVWRGTLNSLTIHPQHSNRVIATAMVPGTVGGWTAREVGIYDDDGDLFAIGNCPETYKPLTSEGTSKDLLLRATLAVGNAAAVTISIDPSAVLATMEYVSANYVAKIGDTMTGPLVLPATSPTTDNQAARKKYVDDSIDAGIAEHVALPDPHEQYLTETAAAENYVAISGDTMTGALVLNADPTLDLHSATKRYVDKKLYRPTDLYIYIQYGGL